MCLVYLYISGVLEKPSTIAATSTPDHSMPSENVEKKVHANGLDVAPVYKLMKTSKSGMFFLIKTVCKRVFEDDISRLNQLVVYRGRTPSSSIPLRTVACGKKKEAELMLEAEVDASMHRITLACWDLANGLTCKGIGADVQVPLLLDEFSQKY
uniref:Uncharacterized protein n=2 Tax=Oryza meridionalis TaxID=40149 RepID=A0A0E0E054_9ORYZ